MSLELKKVTIGEYYTDVHYRIEHWGEGTVVHDDSLKVSFNPVHKGFHASIHIDDCKADTYEEVLDKLARWMIRLGKGIQERGKPLPDFSPIYYNAKPEEPTHVSIGIEEPDYTYTDQYGKQTHIYDSDDLQ